SRIMRVKRFHRLAVKRSAAGSAAARQANGNRTRNIRAPEQGRGLIDDLVESNRREIGVLHFNNRAAAFDGGANAEADNRVLTDGSVHHAAGKFLREIFCGLERAAKRANVLSVNKNSRVVSQCLRLGFADCFNVGNAHEKSGNLVNLYSTPPSLKCLEARAHQFSLNGSGPTSR